jgi:5-methylcytosine-specific restriction endonuclease McrA
MRSAARRIWLWSPKRREAIANARVKKGVVQCAICPTQMKESTKPTLFSVDHKVPASETATNIKSWDDWFERLFECPVSGLQVLCKKCHGEKTNRENIARRKSALGNVPKAKKRFKRSRKK